MSISQDYADALQEQHDKRPGKWGTTAMRYAGGDIYHLLVSRAYIQTILDFGCGQGSLKQWINETFPGRFKVTEYDPGVVEKSLRPADDAEFDLVVSTDVLEHVEPDQIDATLRWLESKTRLVSYHNIACEPTGHVFDHGPYEGEDLHLSIFPPSVWRDKFEESYSDRMQLFEYRHIERRRQGRLMKRCAMIHEKVS